MWWMLGGRRSRRGKKKSRRKKGLKRWKKQQRKIFISIFYIHSRDISIMDIFLMPRTCYMLMLMLFHLIFPFPTPHTHRSLFSFLFSSSSSFEWLLKWDFLNREREKTCEGRVCCFCCAGWSSTLLCINFISFFWCVTREENCNLNFSLSCRSLLCLLFSEKKYIERMYVVISCHVQLN